MPEIPREDLAMTAPTETVEPDEWQVQDTAIAFARRLRDLVYVPEEERNLDALIAEMQSQLPSHLHPPLSNGEGVHLWLLNVAEDLKKRGVVLPEPD